VNFELSPYRDASGAVPPSLRRTGSSHGRSLVAGDPNCKRTQGVKSADQRIIGAFVGAS